MLGIRCLISLLAALVVSISGGLITLAMGGEVDIEIGFGVGFAVFGIGLMVSFILYWHKERNEL